MTEKQLHVRVSEEEMKALERYAKQTKRTKTDILREFLRSLPNKKPSGEGRGFKPNFPIIRTPIAQE